MECFKIDLDLDYEGLNLGGGHRAFMRCYLPSNFNEFSTGRKRPAVIVCPGGAYKMVSEREGEPIALQYTAADMAAFVVNYSVAEDAGFPRCLFEALTAVKTVRQNSADWNIDPDQIVILGFSAGGHLAASAGAFWHTAFVREALGENDLLKPNGVILGYPVITSGPYAHRGSFHNLIGADAPESLLAQVSLEKQVTDAYPPTFLWHTGTDDGVPVQNSLLMASALAEHHILFELHIYPTGVHGLALSDKRTAALDKEGNYKSIMCEPRPRQWVADSISFLRNSLFTKRL